MKKVLNTTSDAVIIIKPAEKEQAQESVMLVEDIPLCMYANDRSKDLLGIDFARIPYIFDNTEWSNLLVRLDNKYFQPIASDEDEVSLNQINLEDVEEQQDPSRENNRQLKLLSYSAS